MKKICFGYIQAFKYHYFTKLWQHIIYFIIIYVNNLTKLTSVLTRISARISNGWSILVSIPVGMTLQLGNWPTIAWRSESLGYWMITDLYQACLIFPLLSDFHCSPIQVRCFF